MYKLICNIYTEKYIDKIIKPIRKYNGKILEMNMSFIQKDFSDMKRVYYTILEFKTQDYRSQFIAYIKNKISNKYDFFLEII